MCVGKHSLLLKSDQPNLKECLGFQGKERIINLPQDIGTRYVMFGKLLLEDNTLTEVHSITGNHSDDIERINTEILKQWITGKGKHPVTWKTLIEVLQDVGLTVLAAEIEAIKCHEEIIETGKHYNSVMNNHKEMEFSSDSLNSVH